MDTTGENPRKKTKNNPFIPDDIIPNILSRLPAKYVGQCRLVCKGWRDLTLTRDFVDLHFRQSLPMILVSNPRYYPRRNNDGMDYLLLDKWWELPERKKLMIRNFNLDYGNKGFALFSHAGIVAFKRYANEGCCFFVGNPMNPKNVKIITLYSKIRWSEIYGVFFHPSRQEYCSLWMIQEANQPLRSLSHPKWIKFKILSLGSNPSMKTISNPFIHRVKRPGSTPILIDKYLYWMLEPEYHKRWVRTRSDIIQFDIISEEFKVMPCPIPLDVTEVSYDNTHLLNIDGSLSLLLILPRNITIWRLEDHEQQLWTTGSYTFPENLYQGEGGKGGKGVPAIVDGKLALLSDGRLIVCNLMQGTIYFRKTRYNDLVQFRSHQTSLASLMNCTSKIFIDQDGEVTQIFSGDGK